MARLPVPVEAGDSYENLVVLKEAEKGDDGLRRILCYCLLCDSEKVIRLDYLRNGGAKSCGCIMVKHGFASIGITEYKIWATMKARCSNPKSYRYDLYGGKGIKVCERWKDFNNFLEDMGMRPSKKHSLDRYPDTNGNYEPGNVRWATSTEQARNRRSTRTAIHNGKEVPIAELAEQYDMSYNMLYKRLRKGLDIEIALTEPFNSRKILDIDSLLEVDHETM